MTDIDHERHYSLGTKTLNYNPGNIEEAPLEDLLVPGNIITLFLFLM